jgi:hypothetical protein
VASTGGQGGSALPIGIAGKGIAKRYDELRTGGQSFAASSFKRGLSPNPTIAQR